MPKSPAKTAITRCRYSDSFKNNKAPMIVKMVDVNPSAETSATGMRVIAKNHNITPMPCTAPRPAKKAIGLDLIPSTPILMKIGF